MGKNLKTPVSVRLNDEELRLLDAAAARFDDNKTAAIVAGLKALDARKEPTDDELAAMVTRRLKAKGRAR